MSQVGVNFASLAGTQSHIASTVGHMNTQLEDLRAYLRPMVSTWEGAASQAYQLQQAKWDAAVRELNLILQQIAQATANANDGFQRTEQTNAARFGG
ncbi:MAG: WXG100 family type VII secretion target [Micrococcales bacterium]|nr:MAG: WXG100 family type VII secretion target [Micrococcales bacterium]